MSALALRAGAASPARPGIGWRAAIRLGSFGALAALCGLRWATLEAPAANARMLACAAIAVAAAATALALTAGSRHRAALLGTVPPGFVAVLLAAGVPVALLDPRSWGDLASGLTEGVQALPGIGVPYQGVDPWVPIVLTAGGGLLLLVGGLLAVHALRRAAPPLAAGIVLTVAYAIPVVEHAPHRPYLGGALFALLLGALLWADRIDRPQAGPALVFAVVAVLGGLAIAPRLDGTRPWLDYQRIADALSTPPADVFVWTHGYGPLDWPRDGRELLRVTAPHPAYWKAIDLDSFDGVRWRPQRVTLSEDADPERLHPEWRERVRVSVRDLRSPQYVGAGTTLAISRSPRQVVAGTPGTFVTARRPLRRGDSYLTEVYAPRPGPVELADAGTSYPGFAPAYLTIALPRAVGGPALSVPPGAPTTLGPVELTFPLFGHAGDPLAVDPVAGTARDGAALLRRSAYGSTYALARRLRRVSDTPYDYVKAVEQWLADGYSYSEDPPAPGPGRPPLVSFLFDTRTGYCQQFSGAMALLLRMGGVPARVASGFTAGTYDRARRDWVVRDQDAHSWVEAWFPGIGWVTFDPTPAAAPPHGRIRSDLIAPGGRPTIARQGGRRADVAARRAGAGGSGPAGISWGWLVAGAVSAAALAGALGALIARRRARPRIEVAPELAELHRALWRTGRPPPPGLTLRGLEERWRRHAPEAAAYVAAVRLARYGGATGAPTAAQRAALRRELAEGLGPLGRLRAWLALPPRPVH